MDSCVPQLQSLSGFGLIHDFDGNLAPSMLALTFLLHCARVSLDASAVTILRSTISGIDDWEPIIQSAHRHGLAPLLYWNLNSHCPELVPPAKLAGLQANFKVNAIRNLMRTQELLRILQWLDAAGIQAVPYKGPALARLAYRDLSLREFFDLDILISAKHVGPASEILIANGYHSQIGLSPKQFTSYLHSGCELAFHLRDSTIELHWQIAPRMFSTPFHFDDLWMRRKMLALGGDIIPSLSPEDLLLVLCVHAMKHGWDSLCWVVDVAELLRATPDLDWNATIGLAREMGTERILLLGLLLAHQLLAAPIPEEILNAILRDRAVAQLRDIALENLRSTRAKGVFTPVDHIFFLRAREHWQDKLSCLLRTLFTPDLADWQSAQIPDFLFPLYRILRVFRLLRKFTSTSPLPSPQLTRLQPTR